MRIRDVLSLPIIQRVTSSDWEVLRRLHGSRRQRVLLLRYFTQHDTRINSAETERVTHYIFQFGLASVIGHNIEVT